MTKPTEADCGWIKLHRQILDSKLWSFSDATFRVAVYLLLSANHKERYVRGKLIEEGQTVRSITRIADDCHLSKKAVRYALFCLTNDKFIFIDTPFGAHQGHRVTICKYGDYQSTNDNRGTLGARAGNRAGNTNKNEENEKNGRSTPQTPHGGDGDAVKKLTPSELHLAAIEGVQWPEAFTDQKTREAMTAYFDHRRRKRAYVNPDLAEKILAKMAGYPRDVIIRACEDAVLNGWQGIFPEKVKAEARATTAPKQDSGWKKEKGGDLW